MWQGWEVILRVNSLWETVSPRALSFEEGSTAALVISRRERKEGGKGSAGVWGGPLSVWICPTMPIVTSGPRVGNLDLVQKCAACLPSHYVVPAWLPGMGWPVSLPPTQGHVLPSAEGLAGEACWVDLLWNCSNSCKATSLSLRET